MSEAVAELRIAVSCLFEPAIAGPIESDQPAPQLPAVGAATITPIELFTSIMLLT